MFDSYRDSQGLNELKETLLQMDKDLNFLNAEKFVQYSKMQAAIKLMKGYADESFEKKVE